VKKRMEPEDSVYLSDGRERGESNFRRQAGCAMIAIRENDEEFTESVR